VIEPPPGPDWQHLQQRVARILHESGFEAETPKVLQTVRSRVEVDVYAVDPASNPASVYLCECKLWSRHVPQAEVLAFRSVVGDVGAHHGLFISARGFQPGAYEVVWGTNVTLMNWPEFEDLFRERWCRNYWIPAFRDNLDHLASRVTLPASDAMIVQAHGGRALRPDEVVGLIALEFSMPPFVAFGPIPQTDALAGAIWRVRDEYVAHLPGLRAPQHLRSLLEYLIQVGLGERGDVEQEDRADERCPG